MQFALPDWVQNFLQTQAGSLTTRQLKTAQARLSLNYQLNSNQEGLRLHSNGDRQVYRLSRLPAIYATICRIGQEIQTRWPEFQPHTLLDLGAGPGTVPLALHQYLPSLEHIVLLEQDREQARWGEQLFAASGKSPLKNARWQISKLEAQTPLPKAELITLSYVLNELSSETRQAISHNLLQSRAELLLIIEPGTPDGYRNILDFRTHALQMGWQIFGPCPHLSACPLSDNDWCHFAARSPRSQLQRHLKEAQESYEDEKFSWLALTHQTHTSGSRILRRPTYRKGVVDLTLCNPQGLWEEQSLSKSHPLYKVARKAHWGDPLTS